MVKVKSSVQPKKQKKRINNVNKEIPKVKNLRRKKGIHKRTKAGVVYLSHIPHGFYEEQIQAYFSQFGKVTAVSVPRSKSGRVKGYAFIEYQHPEIAQIAADTMNNYLMFNRLLKAKYIPPKEQKPYLFDLAKTAQDQTSLAQKALLAKEKYRNLKNKQLTLHGEAKIAAKLLKKKYSLSQRTEKFNFLVEEANIHSILERKKEMERLKEMKKEKNKGEKEKDPIVENWDNLFTDCIDEVDSSKSGREDDKEIVSKAKDSAENISKKVFKNHKENKNSKKVPAKLEPIVAQKQETVVRNDNKSPKSIMGSGVGKRYNTRNTPLKATVENSETKKNVTPKVKNTLKRLGTNVSSLTNGINSPGKPLMCFQSSAIHLPPIPLAEREARRKSVEEFINENISSFDKSTSSSSSPPNKTVSLEKSKKAMKTPAGTGTPKTPTGRKLRQRNLKKMLTPQ